MFDWVADTLAVLARSLGNENFRPLANESLKIAITLVDKVDDPDLRRTTYGLFGALSGILEREMEGVLEHVITVMLGALKSEQGNTVGQALFGHRFFLPYPRNIIMHFGC